MVKMETQTYQIKQILSIVYNLIGIIMIINIIRIHFIVDSVRYRHVSYSVKDNRLRQK